MRYTVQFLGSDSGVSGHDNWAIVLDGVHQVFRGTYTECEDWLDADEQLSETCEMPQVGNGSIENESLVRVPSRLQLLATWWREITVQGDGARRPPASCISRLQGVRKAATRGARLRAFLWRDEGHCNAVDAVLIVALLGAAYAIVALALITSDTLRWRYLDASSGLRCFGVVACTQMSSACQETKAEIACALVHSEESR